MGGMPLLETSNWLHQVTALYSTAIPVYFFVNNFLGPSTMEPVFCRDYLISNFEKISSASSSSASKKPSFVPSSGMAPRLPKNIVVRGLMSSGNTRARAMGVAATGIRALFRR